MAQSQSADDARERISATDLDEGDRAFMGIALHGLVEDVPGTEYDDSIYQAGVEGEVVEALSDVEKAALDDGRCPLADFKIETDSGETFTWNVDNGYVLGYNGKHDRHTDLGKIAGIYSV